MVGSLRGTIDREVIGHFLGADATCSLRTAITNRYAISSPSRILHYRRPLQTTKKFRTSVDAYLLKMKDLVAKLNAAGDTVKENLF